MKMISGRDARPDVRIQSAGNFRPPVMEAAQVGHHGAADHHVVKVRDDEVGAVQSERPSPSEARNNPVRPPMVNRPIKPSAYSIGAS